MHPVDNSLHGLIGAVRLIDLVGSRRHGSHSKHGQRSGQARTRPELGEGIAGETVLLLLDITPLTVHST